MPKVLQKVGVVEAWCVCWGGQRYRGRGGCCSVVPVCNPRSLSHWSVCAIMKCWTSIASTVS